MLAWSHAATAAEAQALLSAALQQDPLVMGVQICMAAGAGAICDLDCYGSAASRSFGWGTEALSWIVAHISGGHRNGTHTVIGDGVFAAVAALALLFLPFKVTFPAFHGIPHLPSTVSVSVGGTMLWLYLMLLFGAGAKALRFIKHDHEREFLAFAAAGVLVVSGFDLAGITEAVLLGTVVHCAGDSVTEEGVAWLEPFSRHRFHFGIPKLLRITTGHWVERWLIDKIAIPLVAGAFIWWQLSAAFPAVRGMF